MRLLIRSGVIVSYRHMFIYFRPKKTGSSTIVEVLRPHLGKHDARRLNTLLPDITEKAPLHSTATEVRAAVSGRFWKRAFKFASERHPYEKAVSLAFFRYGKQEAIRNDGLPRQRFEDLLDRVVQGGEYQSFEYYSIDGKSVVDEFIRHETLEHDLRRIGEKIGIPIPPELPRAKGSYRLDRRPAREILSDAQKEIVYGFCRKEFELLGYER